ncbi:MAG: hypothetical protein ABN482_00765 [Corticimicrobacter sp.]|uniref:NUDIX hydrolase n=1 Tax=Corticimicrobacter sp. TaxID=2678536 RepID=UPI0032DB498B
MTVRPAVPDHAVAAELVAVLVAVHDASPCVLTRSEATQLPSGPFESGHRSLQAGLRRWVEAQTQHPLGYVEQLYTFADGDRTDASDQRMISISYLGLTQVRDARMAADVSWQDCYRYFPWEDWRDGMPAILQDAILPALQRWAGAAPDASARRRRRLRLNFTFGQEADTWHEEMVLQRYELMFEAGLVAEAHRDGRQGGGEAVLPMFVSGQEMMDDHRRILATALARLRAKIRYRPVVFELMPPVFTLLQLQQAFETVAGRKLHKQNFRRFIEQQELVEETGRMSQGTAGRPAKLFQFRGDVVRERAIAGSKLPLLK